MYSLIPYTIPKFTAFASKFLPDSFIQPEGYGEDNLTVRDLPLNELHDYIDWNAFLNFWGFKGKVQDLIYREDEKQTQQQYGLILICLEKKGLISIDFDMPLRGADMSAYGDCPIHGSIALTARGQEVLDVLDKQGAK